ncbi:MAG: hypothetical protein HWD59_13255 [Coxiellaceae bacterium]|nr:MAG: hypothetical protein HWD59_13255 [Coxiellaceae bacterium]
MPSVKEEMAAKVHKIVLTTFYYQHLQVLNQVLSSSFSTQNYITGVDFAICQVNDFEDISYKLQIWALAEHESFRSIARSYYNGSRLMLGVFAAHNSFESSFKVIEDHINDFQQQKSDVPAVLLVSDHLPTQLLDHFSLDKIRQFKIKYKIDYLHVIDPDDIEFESIWVKQWLLMIVLREEAHGGLELLQSRLMHRFAEKYPDAWKVCLQFMTVSFDQDQIIQALQPLNFVQLDRFFNLLVKFHPQQKLWVKAAYLQNARRLLYVALSRHNLSVAQRAYHLLTQHELISYNEVTTVDPLMWRIMADEFSFALQQHYVATEYNFSGHYFNDDDLEKSPQALLKTRALKKLILVKIGLLVVVLGI